MPHDPEAPGASGEGLSVVVQGNLTPTNIAEVAAHCRHWRDLFPRAEIILAVSSTSVLAGFLPGGALTDLRFSQSVDHSGVPEAAFGLLLQCCDKVVAARPAAPLPPIKTISTDPNHVNFLIAAAQAGLSVVTSPFVLRVRGDLVFASTNFMDQWRRGVILPRGAAALLGERVLISSLFTLNPYSLERMPYHFSDWFHFGRTEDVRLLWTVPAMTLANASWYKTHRCAPDSNLDERRVRTRLAVEQHIIRHGLLAHSREDQLDYHNDLTSRDRSIDVLVDNFVVCDSLEAGCIFEKYDWDLHSPTKALHCVTSDDWLHMAERSGAERRAILAAKERPARHPEELPFPRYYAARALSTTVGERNNDTIVGSNVPGVLIYGPYDLLPPGQYTASLDIAALEGAAHVEMQIALGESRRIVAERRIDIAAPPPVLDIDFAVTDEPSEKFELVVTIPRLPIMVVAGLRLVRRGAAPRGADEQLFSATAAPMETKVGREADGLLRTTGTTGHLLYGPYLDLKRGRYRLSIEAGHCRFAGRSFVEVTAGPERLGIVRKRIRKSDMAGGALNVDFTLVADAPSVEFRVRVSRFADFAIGQMRLNRY